MTSPGDAVSQTTSGRSFAIGAARFDAPPPAPGLYLVSTPIGNLEDVTIRALKVLSGVTDLYCEDTRQSRKLLDRYGISRKASAYHDHSSDAVRDKVVEKLKNNSSVALISDAGTPLISDPGYKLVRAVSAAGIPVYPIPGASALLAAVVASGLPTDRIHFHGFLPAKTTARRTAIKDVAGIAASLVFYEAPGRAAAALADLADLLGDRPAALARELTKLHEETVRGTLTELVARFAQESPRGEVVLVVGGAQAGPAATSDADLDLMLHAALGKISLRDAVAEVTEQSGRKKRDVYTRALRLVDDKL